MTIISCAHANLSRCHSTHGPAAQDRARTNAVPVHPDATAETVDTSAEIPQWHRDEIERRLSAHDPARPGRAWDDIEKDLRARMK